MNMQPSGGCSRALRTEGTLKVVREAIVPDIQCDLKVLVSQVVTWNLTDMVPAKEEASCLSARQSQRHQQKSEGLSKGKGGQVHARRGCPLGH